jgi:urea-proton symporter
MDPSTLQVHPGLTPTLGYIVMIGLGAFSLIIALIVRTKLIRTTRDFVASDKRIGLGFGVGSLISVWTWAMAVMMSTGLTYAFGIAGLFWFVVPNGFAVMLCTPFARYLRKHMPQGYTISEFINHRFDKSKAATGIVTIAMIFGIILEILINLKGTSLVMSIIFGIEWRTAVIVGVAAVLVYSYFGGLWTSVMTATLNTLMITVPAAIIVALILDKIGGAEVLWTSVSTKSALNPGNPLTVFRADAPIGFGITLAFGLIAATVADQTFWQKAWSIKKRHVGRSFLWAGAWFYPIPITLGILGLVGIGFGLTPEVIDPIGKDIIAVGPYIVSHIGLPLGFIILYVLIILAACYSTIDGASSALSSVVAVDICKRYWPAMSEKALFIFSKLAMLIGGIISAIIVLTGLISPPWSLRRTRLKHLCYCRLYWPSSGPVLIHLGLWAGSCWQWRLV